MKKKSLLTVLVVCCMAGVSCGGSGGNSLPGSNNSPILEGPDLSIGQSYSVGVVEQIMSLTPPKGVDAELFAQLQNELAKQISARPSQQFASRMPTGRPNNIGDLMFDGQGLSWTYANVGDYDLNGEVNGSDITPIVLHFGKTAASADWAEAGAADGDGNGEVNLSDITPIALNYGSSVSGYIVLGSESEADYPSGLTGNDGPGTQVLGEVSLGELSVDEFGRQTYNVTPSTQLASNLYWVRPVLDSQRGDASYPSTNVGIGLDFEVRRLSEFNLHDPALDNTFIVIPNRTADEITLDVWTTDTEAEVYIAFDIGFDTAKFTVLSSKPTSTWKIEINFTDFFQTFSGRGEAGAMVQHRAELIVHRGPFAQFSFSLEPTVSPYETRVGSTPINETYRSRDLEEGNELEGFTVSNATAQPGQPASFTIFSLFMTGDGDDNGFVNMLDMLQFIVQGTFGAETSSTNLAAAATDYNINGEVNLSDLTMVVLHFFETVDTIEILIWDSGDYADETPLMTFGFFDGTPSKRHEAYPFTATDWRDVFRTWDGEITLAMMQAADTNSDGEVLVSARLRYEDQIAPHFTGIPFTYLE